MGIAHFLYDDLYVHIPWFPEIGEMTPKRVYFFLCATGSGTVSSRHGGSGSSG